MMTVGRNTILEHIHLSFQAAAQSLPAYAHILPFFETLFTLQESGVGVTSPDPAPVPLDWQTAVDGSLRPLLDRTRIPYDEPAAISLLLAICREAGTATPQLAEGAAVLLSDLENKNGAVQRGLHLFMGADHQGVNALGAELNMDPTILRFFLHHGTWPSVARQVDWILNRAPMDRKQWDLGSCPVCGCLPDLAFLAESGERLLVCGYCRHQWPFKRIHCPYCGNQDSHSVIFFFSDAEPAYRIYTCKVCKMYIKTVDTRRLSRPFYPPLEGIVTTHLDLKTQGLGFRSHTDSCTEMAV
jgi:FdhE protein